MRRTPLTKPISQRLFTIATIALAALSLASQESESDNRVADDGPASIQIEVAPHLREDIQIIAKSFEKPGRKNRAEATIELRNSGAVAHRIHARASWLDAVGNNNGGSTHEIELAPRQETRISSATMSSRATRLHLLVRTESFESETLEAMIGAVPWVEVPTLGQIPDFPIVGKIGGQIFSGGTVILRTYIGQAWLLQVFDREVDPLVGNASLDRPRPQVLNINLPREPRVDELLERPMSYGGGHFLIQSPPGSGETTALNADNAWVLQFTKLERVEYDLARGGTQLVGKASGRIYACYRDSQAPRDGPRLAGTFEGMPIVAGREM